MNPGDGLSPLEYGWVEKDGQLVPHWFSGPSIPDNVFKEGCYVASSEVEENNDDLSDDNPWSDDSDDSDLED